MPAIAFTKSGSDLRRTLAINTHTQTGTGTISFGKGIPVVKFRSPVAKRSASEIEEFIMASDTDKIKIVKSDAEWQSQLTPEQYRVTRQHGTERAGTGPYQNEKTPGIYRCICCDAPLFDAGTKYESGTGWPSFFAPIEGGAVEEHEDRSWFMRRVEVRCGRCDAHLGHVFPDGPDPTGQRYCMNGHALNLDPESSKTET